MIKIGEPAIWHSNGIDIPVIINEKAGIINGEEWYFVTGTSKDLNGKTGVPASQLIQKDFRKDKRKIDFESIRRFFDDLFYESLLRNDLINFHDFISK